MNLLAIHVAAGLLGVLPGWAAAQEPVALPLATSESERRPVPWTVGERLEYNVAFGRLRAGTGVMEVRAITAVRGRPAYHLYFQIRGGIPLFRVNDVFQSWLDTTSLASLRFHQDQDEGPKERQRRYEIYPDRRVFTEPVTGNTESPTVAQPIDDGSFLYFLRTIPLEVGRTYTFNNYFRPELNPMTLRVLRREAVRVPAGTFNAIVVQPSIKSRSGIFGENGNAEVWLSDDEERIVVQLRSRLSIGSINMQLRDFRKGPPGRAGSR
jgi:hypothetical protein